MRLSLQDWVLWRLRDLLFAPPCVSAPPGAPLVVVGLFRAASGLGQSARAIADGLEAQGRRVKRVCLAEAFGQADLPPDPRCGPFPRDQTGTAIFAINPPELDRALLHVRLFRPRRWRLIGLFVWETSRAPPDWAGPARRACAIWAPSAFAAAAISASLNRPVAVAPLRIVAPTGIAPDRAAFDLPEDVFVFLCLADARSSLARKNPLGAIAAFRAAFPAGAPVILLIKLQESGADRAAAASIRAECAADTRIRLLDQKLPPDAHWRLLASCDALVSLHRGEGFGLAIAEAMVLGKPVIATAWSGNLDFMAPDAALHVPARLAPVRDPSARYAPIEGAFWAEPDLIAAAAAMRQIVADSALRARLSAAGPHAIAAHNARPLPLND